jgi:hypothetical protein
VKDFCHSSAGEDEPLWVRFRPSVRWGVTPPATQQGSPNCECQRGRSVSNCEGYLNALRLVHR